MRKIAIPLLATALLALAWSGGPDRLSGMALAAPPDSIWVPEHTLPNGTVVPGYWRPVVREGYVWVEGHIDDQGNWVLGHWLPIGPVPRGKVWVPGYWKDGEWNEGHWGPFRAGKAWVPAHYSPRGRWIPGHWR